MFLWTAGKPVFEAIQGFGYYCKSPEVMVMKEVISHKKVSFPHAMIFSVYPQYLCSLAYQVVCHFLVFLYTPAFLTLKNQLWYLSERLLLFVLASLLSSTLLRSPFYTSYWQTTPPQSKWQLSNICTLSSLWVLWTNTETTQSCPKKHLADKCQCTFEPLQYLQHSSLNIDISLLKLKLRLGT